MPELQSQFQNIFLETLEPMLTFLPLLRLQIPQSSDLNQTPYLLEPPKPGTISRLSVFKFLINAIAQKMRRAEI